MNDPKELVCEEKHIVATLEHIKDIEIRKEQEKDRKLELLRSKNLMLTMTDLA